MAYRQARCGFRLVLSRLGLRALIAASELGGMRVDGVVAEEGVITL